MTEIEDSKESEAEQKVYDNSKQKNCDICLEHIDTQQNDPVDCCGQIFHNVCLKMYFISQIYQTRFPIKCLNFKCTSEISSKYVRKILNDQDFQKYEQLQLKKYIDSLGDQASWCPTPDCQFTFILDDDQTTLNCPSCKKIYCLSCKDRQFESFVRGKKYKQCNKCKMWVEKNQGCDHMICRCSNEFCYECGGPYNKCFCKSNQINNNNNNTNQIYIQPQTDIEREQNLRKYSETLNDNRKIPNLKDFRLESNFLNDEKQHGQIYEYPLFKTVKKIKTNYSQIKLPSVMLRNVEQYGSSYLKRNLKQFTESKIFQKQQKILQIYKNQGRIKQENSKQNQKQNYQSLNNTQIIIQQLNEPKQIQNQRNQPCLYMKRVVSCSRDPIYTPKQSKY